MIKKNSKKRSVDLEESIPVSTTEDDSRTVFLVGDIDVELIKTVTERIVLLSEHAPKVPIHLIINTGGGSIDDTFMLYDLIKYIPTPVYTVGLGAIMSAGCLLLAAGEKGKRKMGKNARMMYHCGTDYMEGSIFEIKARYEAFEKLEKQYDKCFAFETGLTLEQVEKLYNKEGPKADKYISATEALQLGIVDHLI